MNEFGLLLDHHLAAVRIRQRSKVVTLDRKLFWGVVVAIVLLYAMFLVNAVNNYF